VSKVFTLRLMIRNPPTCDPSLEEVTKAPQGEEAVYAYVEKMKAAGYKSRAYMRMTRQSAGTEQYDAARSKWEERTAKEVAATKKAQETLGKFGSEYPHLKAKFTEIFSTRDDQNSREIGQMLNMASQSGTANDQSGQPPSHQGTGGDISEGGAGKVV
jgi:hypothetical protein